MRTKLLITPAGYGQLDFILFFKKKNYIIYTLDDDFNAIGHKFSNFKVQIKTRNINKIKKFVKRNNLLVLSTSSDYGFITKNNIIYSKTKSKYYRKLLNKYHQKLIWKKINKLENFYSLYNFNRKLLYSNYFVIKPIYGSGSQNVNLVKNIKEFDYFIKRNKNLKNYYVEKYFKGSEYIFDGFILNKKVYFLLVGKKEKSFFSISYLIYNHDLRDFILHQAKEKISKFLNLMSYPDGPFHSEIIINNNEIELVECHPRCIGYDIYSKLIRNITGLNLFNIELNLLKKNSNDEILNFQPKYKYFCIRFFEIKKSGIIRHIILKRKKFKGIKTHYKLYFKNNDRVQFSRTDSSRFGYVFLLSNKNINLINLSKKIELKNFFVEYK